jgi:putative transposase
MGKQGDSVYLGDQKLPIEVPRVRDQRERKEVPLRSYERLQEPGGGDEGALRWILHGLSCRRHEECADAVPDAFGLRGSGIAAFYTGQCAAIGRV